MLSLQEVADLLAEGVEPVDLLMERIGSISKSLAEIVSSYIPPEGFALQYPRIEVSRYDIVLADGAVFVRGYWTNVESLKIEELFALYVAIRSKWLQHHLFYRLKDEYIVAWPYIYRPDHKVEVVAPVYVPGEGPLGYASASIPISIFLSQCVLVDISDIPDDAVIEMTRYLRAGEDGK